MTLLGVSFEQWALLLATNEKNISGLEDALEMLHEFRLKNRPLPPEKLTIILKNGDDRRRDYSKAWELFRIAGQSSGAVYDK